MKGVSEQKNLMLGALCSDWLKIMKSNWLLFDPAVVQIAET